MTTRPAISGAVTDTVSVIDYAKYNGDLVQWANWFAEFVGGLWPGAMSASAFSVNQAGQYPNLLINGGFELWNKGTSFIAPPNNGAMAADAWHISGSGGSTLSAGRATAVTEGRYQLAGGYTHAAGGFSQLYQKVENFGEYRGRTVAASILCAASVNNNMTLAIRDGVNYYTSASYTASGGGQTLTVVGAIAPNATMVQVEIVLSNASVSAYWVDWAQLIVGPAALTTYAPTPYEIDAIAATRRFQKVNMSARGNAAAANEQIDLMARPGMEMAATPTCILTAGARNAGTPATTVIYNLSTKGVDWRLVSGAAGDFYSVDETLALEVDL